MLRSDAAMEAGENRLGRRIAAVDVARGLALLAMATYHFSWDLENVRLVVWPVAENPLWRSFAAAIAASFLFLSGISLQLAHGTKINAPAFIRRLLWLTAAAALVSAATYLVFPDSWVFFGILHMMVVGSLIALPLRRLPAPLLVLLAAGAVALSFLGKTPALNWLPIVFVGLGTAVPNSNDFVPIFPWIAPILVGLAAGRPIALRARRGPAASWAAKGLALLGRWSLVFYLVHQILLYGLAVGLARVLPVAPAIERARFVADCDQGCGENGGGNVYCRRFCDCVATRLDGSAIWNSRAVDPSFSPLIARAAADCEQPTDFDTSAPKAP